ncbi:type IV secretory system conjugative DNA transfer family protein [Nocardia vermiculata]|uniref:TraM recognition domain-containing protein n=1 Tax=Nocardia vermiculata TaxID=257274 RepID=A0A846XX04_9NOCA|nr:type IV secretory system conjugative DNA transfer family protein [Nocardia vermiculata]NKY51157.1 TraM recognition domain-containing protein [Nocardia vermiculata]
MAKKVKDPADPGPDLSTWMIFIGFGVVGTLWIALHLGNKLSTDPQDVPLNPIACIAKIARGQLDWPRPSTVIVLLVVLVTVGIVLVRRELKKRKGRGVLPIDARAQHMGSGGSIAALTEAGVRSKAEQLGVRLGYEDSPGVPIGVGVVDGTMLFGSYEDLHLDIWGPRQGKTTSRVIPAILSAVGPVLVTSNKRDVVDATRDVREGKGSRAYVFDPQGVAGEQHATWYWDPLGWVDARREGCEMRAARLAGHFADADDGGEGTPDSYFDPEAEDLLAALFLAAAVADRPITQVWEWVTDPSNNEPVQMLRAVGHHLVASGLAQQYNTAERVRDSIFGTAKKMVRCLKLSNVHQWVTPGGDRHQFDEWDFLDRNSTLYCLSLEGRGSAGPLVSALTEAVVDVAMRKATHQYLGRLDIPLLAVLDEAANIVRWKDLPKQYSHFGSRGIVVMTVLQSWAQGVRCWGLPGMEALWAAANIKVLGPGIDDMGFLAARSEVIGEFDSVSSSVSESKGGKSYSRSLGSSRTLTANALATLPRGRAVVFSSGSPAVLVRTVPWWEGEYAAEVRKSIERHDPQRRTTIGDLVGDRGAFDRDETPGHPPTTYGQPEEVRPL